MNEKYLVPALLSLVFSTTGCTSLKSQKLSTSEELPLGLTYRLPAKQFSTKVVYAITKCTPELDKLILEADVSASFTESLIGAEAYTITYTDLNTWTKITNTEFQLSEAGLLTGINASITDQSGTIIRNSAVAVASVARAVAMPQSVGLKSAVRNKNNDLLNSPGQDLKAFFSSKEYLVSTANPCQKIDVALKTKADEEENLKKEKADDKSREKFEQAVATADLGIKSLEDLVDYYKKLGEKSEKSSLLARIRILEKEKLEAETRLKTLGESKTDEIAKKIADAKEKLTIATSKSFVPNREQKQNEIKIDKADLNKLFENKLDVANVYLPEVRISFIPVDFSNSENENYKEPKKGETGIAYRIPVPVVVRLSYKKEELGGDILLSEQLTQVPQLGPIGLIDLKNQIFDDNLIELAFNGNTGSPSKLTFRAKSKAEEASSVARDAAGTYLQLQKDRRDDQIEANKAALDQATAQVALEKAQSDLALSKVQSETSAAKALSDMQQSQVSAQVQLLRDQQRLDAVRTGTATKAEVELEALSTQEQLLAQRLKILRLEQDIAEQEAKALSNP